MNRSAQTHSHLYRLSIPLLAVLLLSLLFPPLAPRAEPPVVDLSPIPPKWTESGLGYWTRVEEGKSTGRTGYTAQLTRGEMVEGEETIFSSADLVVIYDMDFLAGFAERVTASVQPATLKDGRKVDPQVKVTTGAFHGYRATVVEISYSYPSYSYLAGDWTDEGVQGHWEGGATSLRRETCFETTPGGLCTVVREAIAAYTSWPAALGENAEKDTFAAIVAEVDAWKDRWTITGPVLVERKLTATGYDGTDMVHMPLTFAIKAEENGQPLANEPISFRFLGDVQCLADEYAAWDAGSQGWSAVSQNLAVDDTLQAVTDAKGELTLRVVLDFDRMYRFGRKLPCAVELWAAMAAKPGAYDTVIEQRAPVTIRHPVFIRDVFFYSAQDPTGNSRWIRTMLLNESPYSEFVMSGYGRRLTEPVPGAGQVGLPKGYSQQGVGAAYPEPAEVFSRVYLAAPGSSEYASFKPPATQTDYFYPVAGGSKLMISLHDDLYCGTCGANMQPGDGIAVAVMWADGVNGLFSQRLVNERAAEVMFGDGSHYGARTSEESGWIRFAIGQGCDVLVKAGLVAGATWFGGPAAGAWTALLVESWQSTADLAELVEMGVSKKLITFRSEASLTSNPDGSTTLYNFAGSPSVTDEAGNEVFAGEGEAVSFTYDGPVQPSAAQEAPAAAVAMQAVLSQEPGPYEGAVDYPVDAGLESIGGAASPRWMLCPKRAEAPSSLPCFPTPSLPTARPGA